MTKTAWIGTRRGSRSKRIIDNAFWVCIGLFLAFKMTLSLTGSYQRDANLSVHEKMSTTEKTTVATRIVRDEAVTKPKDLRDSVRILCWIMTSPDNLEKKAVHVRNTWANRCNIHVFVSSVTNDSFPAVGFNVTEGRRHLTVKTFKGFWYMYDHYKDQADWFMKADDDTFVIVENLRYFLSNEDPDAPIYFGHHFHVIIKQGYFSGGGGYIVSKEALGRFSKYGHNETKCRIHGGAEDAEFGRCMENLGVKTGNSTDRYGRSRFHCFDPATHIFGGYPDWYLRNDANGAKKGIDSISAYPISFHYVNPHKMYELQFYTYHMRPYGLEMKREDLNKQKIKEGIKWT